MRMPPRSRLSLVGAILLAFCFATGFAVAADKPHYLITNDDVPPTFENSVTFYAIGTNGQLTMNTRTTVPEGGIGGGYFAANRIDVLDSGNAKCVYASVAATGQIEGISIATLEVTGSANGSKDDTGASNGVGLAINSKYLYASFTDSSNIGTFKVLSGCKLKFVSDITVAGLEGGFVDGMVIHGDMMVVTYGDGSIQSFNISAGVPVSNDDEQNSTGSRAGNTYPSAIDITQDGHYAIFGDTSPFTIVEVSDISSGKLTPTVVYRLGNALNASNIMLSPDETLLYISNNQSGKVTAAFFDKSTGTLSKGCVSGYLKGFVTDWAYTASLALQKVTGTGGMIYVAEFGDPATIGEIKVTSSEGKCKLTESSNSPIADPNSPGLLSIGAFPPRPF
jgi:6-phosphogluconolactonase (cycloisomerase 2 family)